MTRWLYFLILSGLIQGHAATTVVQGPPGGITITESLVTPPLDAVTNVAFAAYSTARKLRAAYGGNCIKVRRASDSTEQDIGFITNGAGNVVLDTPALATFCAATDGFVSIVYDQGANGLNLTNVAAAQPKIVNAGAILAGSGSRAIADFDGSNDMLFVPRVQALPMTFFLVASPATFVSNDIYVDGGSSGRTRIGQSTAPNRFNAGTGGSVLDTLTVVTGTYYLARAYFETGTSDSIRINANTEVVGAGGDNTMTNLVLGDGTAGADFNFHEWICFPTAVAVADETILRDNINSFYALF